MHPRTRQWTSHVGRWIAQVGVRAVTEGMRVRGIPITTQTVYAWARGDHVPRPDAACALMDMSRGAIKPEHFYLHDANAEPKIRG